MSLSILFVEKDLTTADLLVPSLERKGYAVVVAHIQRQAASRARGTRPDLLIIDVASFVPRAYRVSEAIRDQLPGIATILLLPEGHDPAGSSAQAYLTQPFTSRRLLYQVRKVAESLPCREIQAGDLNFHSSSHDWLVIAGSKAMYKGVGTINGVGNYGFLISAVDQNLTPSTDTDRFRIKIWDRDNDDLVVYDNMMGEEEGANPTTDIGGGNIVVHK